MNIAVQNIRERQKELERKQRLMPYRESAKWLKLRQKKCFEIILRRSMLKMQKMDGSII